MTTTLRTRVYHAGLWTMSSHLATQLLRFIGNLILTRLLFPEAFGLMGIVQVVLIGLALLSDVGITPSIIRSKQGNTAGFLNTAWSIQVIRGFGIYVTLLLFSFPIATFYDQPLLEQILPVVGLTAIINGFASTHIALANRDLLLKKIALLEIGSYALGLTATITLAWLDRSVWPLVWGALISATIKTVASHFLYADRSNRFAWNSDALGELINFGRWILLGSILTFFAAQGGRLIVGKLIGIEYLAYFILASTINIMLPEFMSKIGNKVLFPAYSKVERKDPRRLYPVLKKSRLIMIIPVWLVAVVVVFSSEQLISMLYDPRYSTAGWMLQYLSIGTMFGILTRSYGGVLWAKGKVATNTLLLAIQIVVHYSIMLIGFQVAGLHGMMLSFPTSTFIMYWVNAYIFSRLKLWQPEIDVPIICLSAVITYIAVIY